MKSRDEEGHDEAEKRNGVPVAGRVPGSCQALRGSGLTLGLKAPTIIRSQHAAPMQTRWQTLPMAADGSQGFWELPSVVAAGS